MKLRITIDGTTYEADVEVVEEKFEADAETAYEEQVVSAPMADAAGAQDDRECRSPVMGRVIRVEAKAGQRVEAGQRVMVLEAMKMETHLTAPRACRVKKEHVAAGESIKVGQLLLEFE